MAQGMRSKRTQGSIQPWAFVAYLYRGLVLTKELWYDLVPDEYHKRGASFPIRYTW
jgi:hypothetical protein